MAGVWGSNIISNEDKYKDGVGRRISGLVQGNITQHGCVREGLGKGLSVDITGC
jgi:hypothetical protein